MTNEPGQGDYWEQEVTMTRAQLQGERDAWYENGLRNGRRRMFDWLRDETSVVWENLETLYVGDR